ncbi:TPA: hypothetical protein ACHIFS_002551 [Bacillus paranthracis]
MSFVSKDLHDYGKCQVCGTVRKIREFCCDEIVKSNYQLMTEKIIKEDKNSTK